jgi:tripartite-type tricarboxylate transporter receptor subunit TctC
MVYDEWFGFFAPAKTPTEVVARLSAGIGTALAAPEVVESLATMGLEPAPSTPAALAALLAKDTARWGPIVKAIGFTAES